MADGAGAPASVFLTLARLPSSPRRGEGRARIFYRESAWHTTRAPRTPIVSPDSISALRLSLQVAVAATALNALSAFRSPTCWRGAASGAGASSTCS